MSALPFMPRGVFQPGEQTLVFLTLILRSYNPIFPDARSHSFLKVNFSTIHVFSTEAGVRGLVFAEL